MGNREKLIRKCVQVLESGQIKSLYSILPHISIVRSPLFLDPLTKLLNDGSRAQRLFAAMALGSIGDPASIGPLARVFDDPSTFQGAGTRSLQKAAILSLGEIGHKQSIDPLRRIYAITRGSDRFTSRRKRFVITALGTLFQHGVKEAESELMELLSEKAARLRAQAVTELGVVYWHSPPMATNSLLQRFCDLTRDGSAQVRHAAYSALSNLAQIGSKRAEECLAKMK
jgi:HEAT repeat protein